MKYLFNLLFLSSFCPIFGQSDSITRGPYLQSMTPNSVVIHWRTLNPSPSKVLYGLSESKLNRISQNTELTTEHVVKLNGLKANQKYIYRVGQKEIKSFKTSPKSNDPKMVRIWALGDFGNLSANQKAVLESIRNYHQKNPIDAWIWLGDNAYYNGKDEEYQKKVFDVYQKDFLDRIALFPSPGNHDYGGSHNPQNVPYFSIFNLPVLGESGGIASHSGSYYAIDYGSLHLISLDSELQDENGFFLNDGKGRQFEWLKKDLAANKLPWVIVYFHKPPYSKGSHDSDVEEDMKKIREHVNPLFEKYKVDVVLSGHSHVYERTFPMRNHFGLNNSFDEKLHKFYKENSPNRYIVDQNGQGVIYMVAGSGGQLGGSRSGYPLKSSVFSNNTIGGSVIFEVTNKKFISKWIASTGEILDQFEIDKK